MPPEEKSSLDKLQDKLYSPNQPSSFQIPSEPQIQEMPAPQAPAEPQHWAPPPLPPEPKPRKPISVAVWFLIGASIFLLLTMGVAAFFLFSGVRMVSSSNIEMKLDQGPTSIASGTTAPLTITVQNNNPADLIDTNITIDFPEGTRTANDITKPLVRYTDTFGTVPAHASVSKTVQAVLFGNANQTVTIPVTFEYHTPNSNQILTKQEKYTFTITSSPLSITTQTASTVAAGQPFTIKVDVRSNASTALDNIAVLATYPGGFQPQSAKNATSTGPFFFLGTLKPGEQKEISISGSLSGAENDQRNFDFTVGTAQSDGLRTLAVPYASSESTLTVSRPFLATSLALNNNSTDPLVVPAGQAIAGSVAWTNTLPTGLTNAQVTVRLAGNALNPSSITTANGFYDSSKSAIVFTRDTEPSLSHLNSGANGVGSFAVALKNGTAFSSLRSPTVTMTVGVAGTPDGGTGAQSITSSLTRTVKVSTDLLLTSSATATNGPLLANKTANYTINLAVTNDVNDVAGATATMILPSYVTFTNQNTASTGTITYDATTHTVTWQIGNIPAGTTNPIKASFQVWFVPSTSQIGQNPILVQNQSLSGTDRFTNTTVEYTASAVAASSSIGTGN